MTRYLFKRIVLSFITIVILCTVSYLIIASTTRDDSYETRSYAGVISDYYSDFLNNGSFGQIYSIETTKSVPVYFFTSFLNTFYISIVSVFVSMFFGLTTGYIMAYYNDKNWQKVLNAVVSFLSYAPAFIIVSMVIIFVSKKNYLEYDPNKTNYYIPWIITGIIVVISTSSLLASRTNKEAKKVLASEFVLHGRTKGLSEWEVFWRIVFKNSVTPLLQFIVPFYAYIFVVTMMVEPIFNLPGGSVVIIEAVNNGEKDLIAFIVNFFILIGVTNTLIADILIYIFDPVTRKEKLRTWKLFTFIKAFKFRYNETKEIEYSRDIFNKTEEARISKETEETRISSEVEEAIAGIEVNNE